MFSSSHGLTAGLAAKRRAADPAAALRLSTAAFSCSESRFAGPEPSLGGGGTRTSDEDLSTHVFHFPAVGSAGGRSDRSSEPPQPAATPKVMTAVRAPIIAMCALPTKRGILGQALRRLGGDLEPTCVVRGPHCECDRAHGSAREVPVGSTVEAKGRSERQESTTSRVAEAVDLQGRRQPAQ